MDELVCCCDVEIIVKATRTITEGKTFYRAQKHSKD